MDILNSIWQQKLSSLSWHLNWKYTCARSDISHQETDDCVWRADKDHPWSGHRTLLCVFRRNQEIKHKLLLLNLQRKERSNTLLGIRNTWKIDQSRWPYKTLHRFFFHKSPKRYSERSQEVIWLDISFFVTPSTCIHLFSHKLLKSSHNIF